MFRRKDHINTFLDWLPSFQCLLSSTFVTFLFIGLHTVLLLVSPDVILILFVLDLHMKYTMEVVPLCVYIAWFVIVWYQPHKYKVLCLCTPITLDDDSEPNGLWTWRTRNIFHQKKYVRLSAVNSVHICCLLFESWPLHIVYHLDHHKVLFHN